VQGCRDTAEGLAPAWSHHVGAQVFDDDQTLNLGNDDYMLLDFVLARLLKTKFLQTWQLAP
jgi:hypothetical protein